MLRWIHSGGASQALAILFGTSFTVAVSIALGARVLGGACREWPVRFVTGAALLSLAVFCLCATGLAYPLVFAAFGVVLFRGWSPARPRLWPVNRLLLIAFGIFFVLYFFCAMAPELSPDGAGYHLSLVARYLREHGFHRITWNMYANLSEGMEMLFLFAFAFGKRRPRPWCTWLSCSR